MKFKRIELSVKDNNNNVYDLPLEHIALSTLNLKEVDEDTRELKGRIVFIEDGEWLTEDKDNIVTTLEVEKAKVTFENCNRVELEEELEGTILIEGNKLIIELR